MLALSSFFLPLCVSERVKPYKTMATTLMSVPPSTCRHLLKLEGKEDIVIFLHELIRDSRYYYIIVIYSNCAVLSVNLFLTKKKKKPQLIYLKYYNKVPQENLYNLKYAGFHHTQFAVPLSERRRTFSGSSCRFRDPLQYSCIRKINIKAATNNSENNKNRVITGKKYELVPRYSKDQHVPRGEFTKFMIALYEFSRPYTMIGTVSTIKS